MYNCLRTHFDAAQLKQHGSSKQVYLAKEAMRHMAIFPTGAVPGHLEVAAQSLVSRVAAGCLPLPCCLLRLILLSWLLP